MITMSTVRDTRLKRDLNNVLTQVNHLQTTVGEESSNNIATLRDRVADATASARDRLSAFDTDVRVGARQAVKATHTYVQDNPWRAIGIGAAVGLLLGVLAARR
jgi:ElaB/YqjD/DUF883 family membrane-anchored ribosome-binding protein